MNIAHDHKTCLSGAAPVEGEAAFPNEASPIDWMELRSRLFATHEVRGALSSSGTGSAKLRLRGSFDGCAASLLTTYEASSTGVNPTASTNCKPERGNVLPVAGQSRTGERG